MAKTEKENLLVAEKAVPGKGSVEIPETRSTLGSKDLRRVKMYSRKRRQLPVRVCDVLFVFAMYYDLPHTHAHTQVLLAYN